MFLSTNLSLPHTKRNVQGNQQRHTLTHQHHSFAAPSVDEHCHVPTIGPSAPIRPLHSCDSAAPSRYADHKIKCRACQPTTGWKRMVLHDASHTRANTPNTINAGPVLYSFFFFYYYLSLTLRQRNTLSIVNLAWMMMHSNRC